jgi:hypothetical protein
VSTPSLAILGEQIVWDWVDAVEISGVDVRIVFVLPTCRIALDIQELIVEILKVSDAMLVISAVPYLSGGLLAYCEGVSAFDVLNAFRCRLVYGRRD